MTADRNRNRDDGRRTGPGPESGPRESGPENGGAAQERIFTPPFLALMTANATLRVSTNMLIVLVPLYALDQGASLTVAGLTTTFYMMAAVVLRPLSGAWVDARGRYAALVTGSVLFCAATGMYVLTLPVWALLAVRVLQGVGFSLNGTAVMTLATDLIPEQRMAEGIGYLGVEQTVAQLFGPWLALSLWTAHGFAWAFGVAFAFASVNLLIRIPLRPVIRRLDAARRSAARPSGASPDAAAPRADADGRPADARKAPWWNRVVDPDAWRPASVMFLLMFGAAAVNTFMVTYTAGHGIENAGPFFTASGVMLAVSRLTAGRVQRRLGTGWVVGPGVALTALSQAAIWWSPNLGVLVLAGAAFGMGMGAAQPMLNSLAVLSVGKERRGRANSTFFMAMDLAGAVGAVSMGVLATRTGTGSVFLMSAALMCAAFICFFALRPRIREH
jgi:MFS family permease